MNSGRLYPYASGDLLENRNTYFYSAYHGRPFLAAWAEQRSTAPAAARSSCALVDGETPALHLIRSVRDALKTGGDEQATGRMLARLVQRFEVTKRVHDAYGETWRAVDPSRYHAVEAYLELADLFCDAYARSGELPLLNALLKLLDTLTSLAGDLSAGHRRRLQAQIDREAAFVADLQARLAGRALPASPEMPAMPPAAGQAPKAVLVACDTARARSYLQAMCRSGMPPVSVLLMGEEGGQGGTAGGERRFWKGLFLPDLSVPISGMCAENGIQFSTVPERDINTASTCAALAGLEADLVVYAGAGGQIVSERALTAGPRFLHMHSGWLPDYRGSTTVYYALLENARPGVSAIYLDPGIDTGPILARRQYPTPEPGMDVDLVYDTAIRADLLCRTLAGLAEGVPAARTIAQSPQDGRTFYVIHPVLKHIALLSLERG